MKLERSKALVWGLACALVAGAAQAADDPIQTALETSQRTGLPILAVAGSKT